MSTIIVGSSYYLNQDITYPMLGFKSHNNPKEIALEKGQVVSVATVNYPEHLRVEPQMSVEVNAKDGLWLVNPDWLLPLPSIWGIPTEHTIVLYIEAGSPLAQREFGLDTGWYWYKGFGWQSTIGVSPTTRLYGAFPTRQMAEMDAADFGIKQALIAQELTIEVRGLPRYRVGGSATDASFWAAIIWHKGSYWAIARGYQFKSGKLMHGESSQKIGEDWRDAKTWAYRMYGKEPADGDKVEPMREW